MLTTAMTTTNSNSIIMLMLWDIPPSSLSSFTITATKEQHVTINTTISNSHHNYLTNNSHQHRCCVTTEIRVGTFLPTLPQDCLPWLEPPSLPSSAPGPRIPRTKCPPRRDDHRALSAPPRRNPLFCSRPEPGHLALWPRWEVLPVPECLDVAVLDETGTQTSWSVGPTGQTTANKWAPIRYMIP